MTLEKKPFENIVGKMEMLVTSIFSFSNNIFNLAQSNFFLFVKELDICK